MKSFFIVLAVTVGAGAQSAHATENQPNRTGYLSPAFADAECISRAGTQLKFSSCDQNSTAWNFNGTQISDPNGSFCFRKVLKKPLVATLACDTNDTRQNWQYTNSEFHWSLNPNLCLDGVQAGGTSQDQNLYVVTCTHSNTQKFTMHSPWADSLEPLAVNPNVPHQYMPLGNGFLGSDAGLSTSLGYNRSLWVFNDTFTNTQGGGVASDGNRAGWNGWARNTVGLMQCATPQDGNDCTVRYFFQNPNRNTAIFTPAPPTYIWPGNARIYPNGDMWVSCNRVGNANVTGGAAVCRVSNYLDTPDLWDTTEYDVTENQNSIVSKFLDITPNPNGVWASSPNDVNYAYAHMTLSGVNTLSRIELDLMTNPNALTLSNGTQWQYLATDNTWKAWPGTDSPPSDASQKVLPPFGNDVQWDASRNVYVSMGQYIFYDVIYSTAPNISGPWSPGKTLASIPEYDSASPDYIAGTTCYAAGPHLELSGPNDIRYAYYCSGPLSNINAGRNISRVLPKPW